MSQDRKARIIATGSYLPEKILSNDELEKMVDTSDDWIFSRTGMKERRIAADHESASDMGIRAGQKVLEESGIDPKEIDLILVATSTPDHMILNTAAIVQGALGATNAGAVDIQAACTGYLYGLSMAKAYVESGMYKHVLLIATEKMSAFVDYQDRSTCVLFGDGASAALISSEGSGLIINSLCLGADGTLSDLILIPAGGSRNPTSTETVQKRQHYFKMNGKEVFRHATRKMSESAKRCLSLAGIAKEDISWFIPHQANQRILDTLAKYFEISAEKVGNTIQKYGNTSAPSVAITLDELIREKSILPGENLLLVAFGAGLTWGASILTKIKE